MTHKTLIKLAGTGALRNREKTAGFVQRLQLGKRFNKLKVGYGIGKKNNLDGKEGLFAARRRLSDAKDRKAMDKRILNVVGNRLYGTMALLGLGVGALAIRKGIKSNKNNK